MATTATTDASEQIVREHAALRRVATLVARQPLPAEVFAAVPEEAGRALGAQTTNLIARPAGGRLQAGLPLVHPTRRPLPGHGLTFQGRGSPP